jgi:hypothetical protein
VVDVLFRLAWGNDGNRVRFGELDANLLCASRLLAPHLGMRFSQEWAMVYIKRKTGLLYKVIREGVHAPQDGLVNIGKRNERWIPAISAQEHHARCEVTNSGFSGSLVFYGNPCCVPVPQHVWKLASTRGVYAVIFSRFC